MKNLACGSLSMLLPWFFIFIQNSVFGQGDFKDCGDIMGYDSYACPCTVFRKCRELFPSQTMQSDYVNQYTTNKDGARLRPQLLYLKNGTNNITVPNGEPFLRINVTDIQRQTILGFGGAFTDSTAYNIMKIGKELGDAIINDYFGEFGLQYNLARIPIGGTDFSLRPYSLDDGTEDLTLARFNLTTEDLDYKIPVIQRAMAMAAGNASSEIRFFATPWSAPAWMKTNNNLTGGGSIKGDVGGEYWQAWAKYFVRYLDAYKAHGINHWGISIQNEPYSILGSNSMFYTPEMMRDFLATTLGPQLNQSGYGPSNLNVMVWDQNLDQVRNWTSTIFANASAAQYAAGTAVHWYSNTAQTVLDEVHAQHPEKFILATEACEGPGVKLGAWRSAERYAYDIIQDLLHWSIGWTDWNLVLDMQGGPSWTYNFVDAPIIIDPAQQRYIRQPHYYVMGHFSKYIRPGAVRVDTQIIASSANNKAIIAAFKGPEANRTTMVIVNNDDQWFHLIVQDKKKLFKKLVPNRSIVTLVYYD